MLDKNVVLQNMNVPKFYQSFIHSLKINGKAEAMGICAFHNDHNLSLTTVVADKGAAR